MRHTTEACCLDAATPHMAGGYHLLRPSTGPTGRPDSHRGDRSSGLLRLWHPGGVSRRGSCQALGQPCRSAAVRGRGRLRRLSLWITKQPRLSGPSSIPRLSVAKTPGAKGSRHPTLSRPQERETHRDAFPHGRPGAFRGCSWTEETDGQLEALTPRRGNPSHQEQEGVSLQPRPGSNLGLCALNTRFRPWAPHLYWA